jgi:hypothetical protein
VRDSAIPERPAVLVISRRIENKSSPAIDVGHSKRALRKVEKSEVNGEIVPKANCRISRLRIRSIAIPEIRVMHCIDRTRRIQEDGASILIRASRNKAAPVQFHVIRVQINASAVQIGAAVKKSGIIHKKRAGNAAEINGTAIARPGNVPEERSGDDDAGCAATKGNSHGNRSLERLAGF